MAISNTIVNILLVIFLPPLAVYLVRGGMRMPARAAARGARLADPHERAFRAPYAQHARMWGRRGY
jgi:hypothetical protein